MYDQNKIEFLEKVKKNVSATASNNKVPAGESIWLFEIWANKFASMTKNYDDVNFVKTLYFVLCSKHTKCAISFAKKKNSFRTSTYCCLGKIKRSIFYAFINFFLWIRIYFPVNRFRILLLPSSNAPNFYLWPFFSVNKFLEFLLEKNFRMTNAFDKSFEKIRNHLTKINHALKYLLMWLEAIEYILHTKGTFVGRL